MLQPRVTDISHHNTVTDIRAAAAAGLWGVINKATQGSDYQDRTYAQRRSGVLAAGMLWGAYHFGDNSDPVRQVDAFLAYAKPDVSTLLCLDYEDHPQKARSMRPAQMVAFLREIERRTGRKATLYSGNVIKENFYKLSPEDRAFVAQHPLWLCQYGNNPRFPKEFGKTFLWQYTDGVVGPEPHRIAGITGQVDLNMFNGTRDELASMWRSGAPAITTTDSDTEWSSQSRRGEIDESYEPAPSRGDTEGFPPFPSSETGGLNVQPQTARFDVAVQVVQTELDRMGYHEVGTIDGKWGGKTAAAIKAFFVDRGLESEHSEMGPLLNSEIAQAKADGWTRPIAPERANATPKDLAPKIETVRVSLWGRFTAKIAAGFAAIGITGSSLSSAFQSVQDTFYPIRNALSKVPPEVWFGLMGATALAVWYVTSRTAKAATKDYNTGRLN